MNRPNSRRLSVYLAWLGSMSAGCVDTDLPAPAWYACDPDDALGGVDPAAHPHAGRYQRIVDNGLELGVPAVSAAVISPEGTWVSAGGQVDIAQNISAETCHRFHIASVTKMYTAASTLRLVDRGPLSLDHAARRYLPNQVVDEIPNLSGQDGDGEATLRQLLQHTSGIPDYLRMSYFTDAFNLALEQGTAAEELEWVYGDSALFPPGTDLQYSNSNYLLLSLILGDVTGRSAYGVVHKEVSAPLGLNDTLGRSEAPRAVARGYADLHGTGQVVDHTELTTSVMGGAGKLDGGLVSTPLDTARFLDALMHGDVVDDTLLESEMMNARSYPRSDDLETGYGLGLARLDTPYGEAWGHYGSVYPYQALAFYFPDHDTTVVVFLNGIVEGWDAWFLGPAVFAPALE